MAPFSIFRDSSGQSWLGKFRKFGDLVRGKNKEEAISNIMKNRFVKKLGAGSLDSYRGMLDGFIEVCQWIDKDSVRRIADTCYKCDLPDFDEDRIRRFTFLYSENEPARKAEERLRKKIFGCGVSHCEGLRAWWFPDGETGRICPVNEKKSCRLRRE